MHFLKTIICCWCGNINNADIIMGNKQNDALVVVKDGSVTLPSATNTLIDADTTGKIAVTKEWVTATVPKVSIQITCSDLVTNITTGITKGYFEYLIV
jgi:ribosomal protein L6P/L9E